MRAFRHARISLCLAAMKIYEIPKGATSLESLRRAERPDPKPGPSDILVRIRAVALNYRDHAIITGKYRYGLDHDTIPCSDAAGEAVSTGANVTRFKPGDRVIPSFFQVWIDGAPPKNRGALGSPLDGTLAEFVSLHEDGWVAMPKSLSFEEAATLPCAGPTAWNGLMMAGTRIKPGDTVLCLGTGGVSMFALQIARAAGARVIVTSSSDAKIERAKQPRRIRRRELQNASRLGKGSPRADRRARRGLRDRKWRHGHARALVRMRRVRWQGGADRRARGAARATPIRTT